MLNDRFVISFDYPLDADASIFVKADAKYDAKDEIYHVNNFRSLRGNIQLKLPAIGIRAISGRWVHADSETPTLMSEHAGNAITCIEQANRLRLQDFLEKAIQVDQADFGNIQLLDRSSKTLRIVAQKGFNKEFLDHFKIVSAASSCGCGDALKAVNTVIVPDVLEENWFPAHKNAVMKAGVRSVISIPVMDNGSAVGMLSVHSSQPGRRWEISERQSIAEEIGKYIGQQLAAE